MQIPLVDLKAQYASIKDEIDAAIRAAVERAAFIGGPFVQRFEDAFARYCERPHAVGCGNGTDALRLAMEALGIGAGDEVIVPSHTFFASAEAVAQLGAVPVFADVEEGGFTLDPAAVAKLVTRRTRAVIPVHLYGHPCDMDAILEIARRHDLEVIEDCAQAHGARYKGRRTGTFGAAGCFSFYPAKNLGAFGDAGAVVTANPELARRVAALRDHGRSSKFDHERLGVNSRLDDLQAAVLCAKLPHLDAWNEARRRAAAEYDRLLADEPRVGVPAVRPATEPVYHLYVVRVPERDRVANALRDRQIGAGIHYPIPCHLQRPFAERTHAGLPRTERLAGEVLSLPLFPEIRPEEIRHVAETLRAVLSDLATNQELAVSAGDA
ncbi:MAG: DegT/DnrJ/EryC1/StrS family aminotransferase [Deltaproteobacteria bacterium]|nr:MAG: DegT/DnrJ/EryC1/StrS family aminotransferase [Deltaproteobacteria bacterium]